MSWKVLPYFKLLSHSAEVTEDKHCTNSPGLLLVQLSRVRVLPAGPDSQLVARGGTVQQGCYFYPQVQVGVGVQTQPPKTEQQE